MPPGGGLVHMPPGGGLVHMPPEGGLPYATQRWASLCHPKVGLFNENLHSSYIHKINPANIMFNFIYSGTLH